MWKNHPCNINDDFKTTITDFGVCYTFNANEVKLTLRKPGISSFIAETKQIPLLIMYFTSNFGIVGSSSGLSLIINVEQYEYMTGPQTDAGVKVKIILAKI